LCDLRVPYQPQIPSRPGGCEGVGLPSLYVDGLSPRPDTTASGFSAHGEAVLACRQIAPVIIALPKTSHVLAINGYDKGYGLPKIRDAVNKHVTRIGRWRTGSARAGCFAGIQDQSSAGQTQDMND